MTEQNIQLMQPPADVPEIQRGNWFALPDDDPVVAYIAENYWDQSIQPEAWQVARLSSAAYVYREKKSKWTIVAKFYSVKTGDTAETYSMREFTITENVFKKAFSKAGLRAVKPIGVWKGILFLEYIDGLTLEDLIAVRRSRPGTLMPAIENASQFLASLHRQGSIEVGSTQFPDQMVKARKILRNLAQHGVIQDEPLIEEALNRQLDRWENDPRMTAYVPALTHGDTTTSNFVYPWSGGTVALDWERARIADPAFDLGRLMAEVSHSIKQHGGSHAEAHSFVDYLAQVYSYSSPGNRDVNGLLERSQFYRAVSTLRIARNGWVSRLDRTILVAQSLALLETS